MLLPRCFCGLEHGHLSALDAYKVDEANVCINEIDAAPVASANHSVSVHDCTVNYNESQWSQCDR